MIAVNSSTEGGRLKGFFDRATTGSSGQERYNELEKAERNAAYLNKLERGLEQVQAGYGISKTLDALEALADNA